MVNANRLSKATLDCLACTLNEIICMLMIWCFLFAGEESVNMETVTKPALHPTNEKSQFVDKLVNSITKRKRSTPQKFLGEFVLRRRAMLFI